MRLIIQVNFTKFRHKFVDEDEVFDQLAKGVEALANSYKSPISRDMLERAIRLIPAEQLIVESGGDSDIVSIIQYIGQMYEVILGLEPEDGGGPAVEISRILAKEARDLVESHAGVDKAYQWYVNANKLFRDRLNHGKPF